MSKLPLLLLASLLPVLSACSSAPIRYHTLVPAQPGAPAGRDIRVQSVSMPPQVDRSQLVVRQGDSGLAILETEWWGAILVDEFRNALEDQLGSPKVGHASALLRVDVLRFDAIPGRYALLDASWRLQRPDSDKSLVCRSRIQTAADNSVDSLVLAQQSNLHQLVEQVVQANSNGASHCP